MLIKVLANSGEKNTTWEWGIIVQFWGIRWFQMLVLLNLLIDKINETSAHYVKESPFPLTVNY